MSRLKPRPTKIIYEMACHSFFLFGQCKDEECRCGLGDMGRGFRIDFRKPAFGLRAAARTNGDELPPINRITYGSRRDAASGVEGPQLLPGFRIQRENATLQIAAENQVA